MVGDFAFLKGNIETIILTALYKGDKYGYEIVRDIKEKTSNKYEIKQPTLYAYLRRLESEDLISSYWGNESLGGRRKYFTLTDNGKTLCEQFIQQWQLHRSVMNNLVDDKPLDLTSLDGELPASAFLGSKRRNKRAEKKVSETSNTDDVSKRLDFLEVQRTSSPNVVKSEQLGLNRKDKDISFVTRASTSEIVNNTEQTKKPPQVHDPLPLFANRDKKEALKRDAVEEFNRIMAMSDVEPDSSHTSLHPREPMSLKDTELGDVTTSVQDNTVAQRRLGDSIQDSKNETQYRSIINNLVGNQLKAMPKSFTTPKTEPSAETVKNTVSLTINELAEDFLEQGIRMRVYNKVAANYRSPQMLKKNKLVFTVSWVMLLFVGLQMLLFWAVGSNYFEVDWRYLAAVAVVPALLAIYATLRFLIDPKRQVKPKFNFKYSILNALIAFALIALFVVLINILFIKTVFTNIDEVFMKIVLPLIAAANILFIVIVYKLFYARMLS